jgi:hypothetical protein
MKSNELVGGCSQNQVPSDQLASSLASDFTVLQIGNFLFAPEENLVVRTCQGTIKISKGCVALVVNSGNSVAVLSLHDTTSGSISTTVGSHSFTCRTGEELILTSTETKLFDDANPIPMIPYRQEKESQECNNTRVFTAEFSLQAALTQVQSLHNMLHSSNNRDRQLIGRIMLNATILAQLTGAHGPYKTAQKTN